MHQQRSSANKESLKCTKPLQLTSDGLVTDDLAKPGISITKASLWNISRSHCQHYGKYILSNWPNWLKILILWTCRKLKVLADNTTNISHKNITYKLHEGTNPNSLLTKRYSQCFIRKLLQTQHRFQPNVFNTMSVTSPLQARISME